jgi:DNA-binding transcriptional LysR family regulator
MRKANAAWAFLHAAKAPDDWPDMNLLWLDDFLTLAASGNFTRAAEERHMTQPAFSRRIRALEEWLGVVLFDRSAHPATLTEAGEWFRTTAQEILARVARVPDEARAVADNQSATLRFAATHALSFTFLPAWLRSLEARTAIGPIQLVSDVLQQCEALALQGRVQFALCHAHARVPGRLDGAAYPNVQVGSDALLAVSAADGSGRPRHRLGARGKARVPMLGYSAESGIGRILRSLHGAALEQAGVEPVFTAHLASVLKPMTLDGRGIAWLPRSLIDAELEAGTLVEAADARWQVALEIRLFRNPAVLSRAAELFWRAVVEGASGPPSR